MGWILIVVGCVVAASAAALLVRSNPGQTVPQGQNASFSASVSIGLAGVAVAVIGAILVNSQWAFGAALVLLLGPQQLIMHRHNRGISQGRSVP